MKYLLLILALTSCGKHNPVETKLFSNDVRSKAALYKSLNTQWSHGKCDSLGFTALCKISGGCQDADIFLAEDDGMWYRTPDHKCYDAGESKSDFSKDMMVMLLPYLYSTGNIDAIKRIKSYGKSHNWVFGRGPISRTLMTPPIIAMIYKMTGDGRAVLDFEKHLDMVWAITTSLVLGVMPESQFKKIEAMAEDQPRNALAQALMHKYSDGDQAAAIAILLDETIFPIDRLPSARDRCEPYIWQRDTGPDWAPCDSDLTHDGIDFLFAAWVAGQT